MRTIPGLMFSTTVLAGVVWVGVQIVPLFADSTDWIVAIAGDVTGKSDRLQTTAALYRVATVEPRRIIETVQATGSITPVALVSVSSQISGQIKEIYADFNQEVREGDPIALIDPLSFTIAVEQAEAQVGTAKANVVKANVTLRDAEADFQRQTTLNRRGLSSEADRSKSETTRDLAAAALEDARSALLGADAALKQARADLDRTIIRSPVDGIIIVRSIEIGTIVAVSLQAPTLFTIAQDLREMQVNTSVPEAEIGRIRVGQRMDFTADSYPGRTFQGEVVQIRKQPQTTQNVVTYTVVASAPNPELLLLPGMTATARIITDDSDARLAVPNVALRFRPPGQPRSLQNHVFVERYGRPVAIPVQLGPTDGGFTAISGSGIEKGDEVLVGLAGGTSSDTSRQSGRLLGIF